MELRSDLRFSFELTARQVGSPPRSPPAGANFRIFLSPLTQWDASDCESTCYPALGSSAGVPPLVYFGKYTKSM